MAMAAASTSTADDDPQTLLRRLLDGTVPGMTVTPVFVEPATLVFEEHYRKNGSLSNLGELIRSVQNQLLNPDERTRCVPWPRSVDKNGFGYLIAGRVSMRVHRAAFAVSRGLPFDLPDIVLVRRKCRTSACINIWHLETNGEGRFSKGTHCRRGHLWDEKTIYRRPNGSTECKECRKILARDRDNRERQEREAPASDLPKYLLRASRRIKATQRRSRRFCDVRGLPFDPNFNTATVMLTQHSPNLRAAKLTCRGLVAVGAAVPVPAPPGERRYADTYAWVRETF